MKVFSIIAIRIRMAIHAVWPLKPARTLFLLMFSVAGVLFVAGDYFFFRRVFENLLSNTDIGVELMVSVSSKLMALVLMSTFMLLIFSTAVSSLSYLYLDEDLTLLQVLPISRWKLRYYRAAEGAVNAGYMVAILLIPVVAAYLSTGNASLLACVVSYSGLLFYLIIPAVSGTIITVVLARFFPAKRIHQLLTVMTVVMICLLVVLFRMAKPEALLNPGAAFEAVSFMKSIKVSSGAYMPSTWLSDIVVAASNGQMSGIWRPLAFLGLISFAGVIVLGLFMKAFHWKGYSRAQEHTEAKGRPDKKRLGNYIVSFLISMAPAGRKSRAVLKRDVLVFTRDPTQWGQVIILGAVIVIYIFNVRFMPTGMAVLKVAVAFWNLATLGFIVSAVAGRFAFTSIGSEGHAFFHSRILPIDVWSYLWAKYLFTVIPLSILAVATLWVSNHFLGVSGDALYFTSFLAACASLALSALALGMGAMDPVFNARNPAKAVMSFWGLGYMFVSLFYVGGLATVAARPVYHYYSHLIGRGPAPRYINASLEAGLVSALIVVLSFVLAGRRLKTIVTH